MQKLMSSGSCHRQRRRVLDLLHCERRADVEQLGRADELFVDEIVARDVRHHDAQQVIDVAAHAVELDDFGNGADGGGSFGWMLFKASLACFVHAVLPFAFEKTASLAISELHARMVMQRGRTVGAASAVKVSIRG